MKTLEQLLDFGFEKKIPFILATVVSACGSTPQVAGVRMIIFVDGFVFGTIGGGCVEGTVIKKAINMLVENNNTGMVNNQLHTVDLTDEIGTRDGDVCGGSMTILLEIIKN